MNISHTRRLRAATQRTSQSCMLRRGLFTSCCILSLGLLSISSRPACALERISDGACSHIVGQVKYYDGGCTSPGANFCGSTAVTCSSPPGSTAYSVTLTPYNQCSGKAAFPGTGTCRRGTHTDNNGVTVAPNINVVSTVTYVGYTCTGAGANPAVPSCPQPNCY